uniref:Uncharacterized protein n=1 Tax=Ascaris lumbricoides TaxID=6252 RepID=A0A0M3I2F1_ASCLU
MLLIIASFLLIFMLLLWKWLDITCVDSLKKILKDVLTSREKHFLSNLFQVDENSKRHGGELVAAVLKVNFPKDCLRTIQSRKSFFDSKKKKHSYEFFTFSLKKKTNLK